MTSFSLPCLVVLALVSCDRSRSVSIATTCDDVAITANTAARSFAGSTDGDIEVSVVRTKRELVPVILPMPIVVKPQLAERPE